MAIRKRLKTRPQIKATVRRSQLITTYGVGSLIPVESESFMVAGLENWNVFPEMEIDEPRLCAILGVSKLYMPPGGEVAGMLPMVRFPEWVSCPKCNRLDRFWKLADKPKETYENRCRHCLTVRLVPSRFVACCAAGHIQDFPYLYWVHQGAASAESDHTLRITTNPADGSLGGITIKCSCGANRTLRGALGSGSLSIRCSGRSPWLDNESEECGLGVVALQRGASNVWFADVQSALTVDRSLTAVEQVLERVLPELEDIAVDDVAMYLQIMARKWGVEGSDLVSAYRRRAETGRDSASANRELREAEYEALGRLHPEIEGNETFVCYPESYTSTESAGRWLEVVSRIPRLREVRALTGFARVSAVPTGSITAAGKLSRKRVGWLPAMEVLGEGVFLKVREEALAAWEASEFARSRADAVNEAAQGAAAESAGIIPTISPRFLLLHSLAHCLLRELALDTGYPASSIRERVYAEQGQSGILLFTATADAAGSLGGLCSQGTTRNLARIFASAIESAQWCSADPVCLESVASGAGATNMAACHSCLLAPEVSCEHQNRYLDRGTLIGNEAFPEGGFLTGDW